jgi:hypothetical protein
MADKVKREIVSLALLMPNGSAGFRAAFPHRAMACSRKAAP